MHCLKHIVLQLSSADVDMKLGSQLQIRVHVLAGCEGSRPSISTAQVHTSLKAKYLTLKAKYKAKYH